VQFKLADCDGARTVQNKRVRARGNGRYLFTKRNQNNANKRVKSIKDKNKNKRYCSPLSGGQAMGPSGGIRKLFNSTENCSQFATQTGISDLTTESGNSHSSTFHVEELISPSSSTSSTA
jgi:hypothetical protein